MDTSGAQSLNSIRPARISHIHDIKVVDIIDMLSGNIIVNAVISSSAYATGPYSDAGLLWRPSVGAQCLYTNVDGIGAVVLSFVPEFSNDETAENKVDKNSFLMERDNSIGLVSDTGEAIVIDRGQSVSLIASIAAWLKMSKLGRMMMKIKEYVWQWFGGYEKAQISGNKVSWEKAIYAKKYTAKDVASFLASSADVPGVYLKVDDGKLYITSVSSTNTCKISVEPGEISLFKNDSKVLQVTDIGIFVYGDITMM